MLSYVPFGGGGSTQHQFIIAIQMSTLLARLVAFVKIGRDLWDAKLHKFLLFFYVKNVTTFPVTWLYVGN